MRLMQNNRYAASLNTLLSQLDLSFLNGRTIVVTGATGMLGSCLIDTLMLGNQEHAVSCKLLAIGRNTSTAAHRFEYCWEDPLFSFQQHDICRPIQNFPEETNYIIHAASNADPVKFALDPVHTLTANVLGTKELLEYGYSHNMQRFLYVSSGEIYGQPDDKMKDFFEDYCGSIDLSSPRSSYPSGKRATEVLCQSYIYQYQVDAVIVRPCHLFGPTMTPQDSRAVSEFLRNAAEGKDIIMKSAGLLERSHCYVMDAVQAILIVLKSGACGAAYNIADRQYQMTIREFAEQAAAAGGCHVLFDIPNDIESRGYSVSRRMVLNSSRLEKLGWTPQQHATSAIAETVRILRESGA